MKRSLLCLSGGALMVAAMPPYNLWPLLFAGFSLFYLQLAAVTTARQAALYGWLFGFGYFAAGLWWIANALLVDGNEFRWIWPLAIAGLPAGLAVFPMMAAFLSKRLADLKTPAGFLIFCCAFGLSEWLRGHIFTGFPWNLYGYGWSGWNEILQTLSAGGPYLLTLLTVFWASLPAYIYLKGDRRFIFTAVALALFCLCLIYGTARLREPVANHDDLAIRLVQPNISQEDKWNPLKAGDILYKMLDLSRNDRDDPAQTTLIVWPETALSYQVFNHANARAALRDMMDSYPRDVFLMTGLLQYEDEKYYNSLAVINRDLEIVSLYHKSHLVPFGEYIPFQDFLPLSPFVQFEGFTPGSGPETKEIENIPSFSPLVCYEIIFPQESVDRDHRPDWIVNVTNDAWYGDTAGPRQHFAMARYRAIERGVPVLRSANTGISGLIDPLGRAVFQANLTTEQAQTLPLPLRLDQPTLFHKCGDLLLWLLFASAALLASYWRRV